MNSRALTPEIFSNLPRISLSRAVVVGEVRFNVSETKAGEQQAGNLGFGNSTPFRKKQSATMVLVEPTGSFMKRIGCRVVSAPMRW